MDALYVVGFIVIIILLISFNNSMAGRIDGLERMLFELHNMLEKLKQSPPPQSPPPQSPQPHVTQQAPPPVPAQPKPMPPPQRQPDPVPEASRPYVPQPPQPVVVERREEVIEDPLARLRKPPITIPPPQQRQPPEPRPSFFESHPDLEKFIGENLVNKIGIAILVLAIGYFVKYAIDNDWVGPAGRVGIGILCGGILVGIAHRLRNSYKAFSSVLVGGGIAVFYFTITLAFHQFHLPFFSQTITFITMIVITCFAVALSLLYDRQELAVIALIGGISSPFMVSTGNANYNALFTYMIILNAGLLIIAYYKSWRVLNISAFALTVIVLGGIVYTLPEKDSQLGFIYISILYLLFFLINIANNIRENKKFLASDFTILLINTALYFSTGLYLLTVMHDEDMRGLFCASIGGLNLLFSYALFKSKKAEINILYLLIGITLTFLSLTAPIQLHGHFITLFWAAESVLIYWLYTKSNIKIMQWASLIIWVAMIGSLMIDWVNLYAEPLLYTNQHKLIIPVIANKGFITAVFSAVCSFLLYLLVQKQADEKRVIPSGAFKYAAFIMLFLAGLLEVNYQFLNRFPDTQLNTLYLMLYTPVFMYLFLGVTRRFDSFKIPEEVEATLLSLTLFVCLLCSPIYFDVQGDILARHKLDSSHFMAHWVADIFALLIFYRLINLCKTASESAQKPLSWLLAGGLVLFLSLEVCLLTNAAFYTQGADIRHIETVYVKTGLPVLWGVASFAMMWLGMRYKTRVLRIISLTLFSLTLIKLFAYDIQNIPAAGKIAAFFCLGVLLLIISFMYQKVKVIITDDEDKTKN